MSKPGSDCAVVCHVDGRRCLALSEAVSDVVVGRRTSSSCWWLLVYSTVQYSVVLSPMQLCVLQDMFVLSSVTLYCAVSVQHFSLFIFDMYCHGIVFVVMFKETALILERELMCR